MGASRARFALSLGVLGEAPYAKIGLGGWYYSAEFDRIGSTDAYGTARQQRGNFSVYMLSERTVYREPQAPLGAAAAFAGHEFEREGDEAGLDVDGAEVAIELTYRAQLTRWLALQPDVQYIVNPSFDSSVDDALALGVRFEVAF